MPINTVQLSNTFGQWVTVTNSLVTTVNAQLDNAVLATLTTSNKSTLVAALNEINSSKLSITGGTVTGSLTVGQNLQVNNVISIGVNNGGNSIIDFFDDTDNVSRRLMWNNADRCFTAEDAAGNDQKVLTTGQEISLGILGPDTSNIELTFKNGNETINNTYVGPAGEITIDNTNRLLRVHDGSTPGGAYTVGGQSAFTGDYKTSVRREDHENWLLCDGRLVSKTTYSNLYSLIGPNAFGTDTSTHFPLPDGRGRSLLSENNTSIPNGRNFSRDIRNRGQVGGNETHSLTGDENGPHIHENIFIPASHDDNPDPPLHRSVIGNNVVGGVSQFDNSRTGTSGAGVPHNNMHPFIVAGNLFIYAG